LVNLRSCLGSRRDDRSFFLLGIGVLAVLSLLQVERSSALPVAAPRDGLETVAELVKAVPELEERMDLYDPDPAMQAALHGYSDEVRVRLLYGLWCPVCERVLPRGLRVLAPLENESGWQVELTEIANPPRGSRDPEAVRLGVRELPAALVFRDGQEVGRFVGADGWRKPEQALARALGLVPQRHRPATAGKGGINP
jgi:thiol-disulfide isomerase/thioredoxin